MKEFTETSRVCSYLEKMFRQMNQVFFNGKACHYNLFYTKISEMKTLILKGVASTQTVTRAIPFAAK